jgi:hypothetical protein
VQLLPWLPLEAEGLLVYAGTLLVWAEALYVLTRSRGGAVPTLATLAMGSFSIYLIGLWSGALESVDTASGWTTWLRYTFWGGSLSVALWLSLVIVLASEEGSGPFAQRLRSSRVPALVTAIATGVLFGVLGVSGESILVWSGVYLAPPSVSVGPTTEAWHVPVGPLFGLFQAYLLLALGGSVVVLAWLWRSHARGTPLHPRFGGLLACGLLFLLGGGYIGVASAAYHASAFPGELLLVVGMFVMGWNVAHYGALLSGEVNGADLRAYALSTLALVGLYTAILFMLPANYAWAQATRLLLLAVMTTHVLADRSALLMDRLVFDARTNALRRSLRVLADRTVRQPDPNVTLAEVQAELLSDQPAEDQLRTLLEGALRQLTDPTRLSRNGLIGKTPSTVGRDLPAMEASHLLRTDLLQAIERLRPESPRPTPGASSGPGGWMHYLVLHEAYVVGRPNKQIMQRYYLSESTFHRARRAAVDTLVRDLQERMLRRNSPAGHAVAAHSPAAT